MSPAARRPPRRAERDSPQRFPDPASGDLLGGTRRNFQVFDPLDFLAELVQHIPNKGEHLIRYYGHYSNKARGVRAKRGAAGTNGNTGGDASASPLAAGQIAANEPAPADPPFTPDRRRWAMLIKRVYQVDPLLCPNCGGPMKIIAFIEARQEDVIRKILRHCGLWQDPPPRGPPQPVRPFHPRRPRPLESPERESSRTHEADPDFLEHLRREQGEQFEQPELPWEP